MMWLGVKAAIVAENPVLGNMIWHRGITYK